jgi:hypothetical protein
MKINYQRENYYINQLDLFHQLYFRKIKVYSKNVSLHWLLVTIIITTLLKIIRGIHLIRIY